MLSNVLFQCPELIKAIELTNANPFAHLKTHPLLLIHGYLGNELTTEQLEMSRLTDSPVSSRVEAVR